MTKELGAEICDEAKNACSFPYQLIAQISTDKTDLSGFRPHQQSCIAYLIDLLCSVLSWRQKEGGEPFGIAAIHRTDCELGFCIWVMP